MHRFLCSIALFSALSCVQPGCSSLERMVGLRGPVVVVVASSLGPATGSHEQSVASLLEHELGLVDQVVNIESSIETGTVTLRIEFAAGSDLAVNLFEVRQALVEVPPGLPPDVQLTVAAAEDDAHPES